MYERGHVSEVQRVVKLSSAYEEKDGTGETQPQGTALGCVETFFVVATVGIVNHVTSLGPKRHAQTLFSEVLI